ncbi:major facilitator superfamily-like protein [Fragilaria crotonensis]|nr:major facilitator superfamily-like protein [Fragilaria crotonensis]
MSTTNEGQQGAVAPTIEGMDTVYRDAAEALRINSVSDDDDDDMPASEKQMMEEERSFYSNSENNDGDDNIWGLLSGASRELQLINSFGVYLAAFLMRPLGAIMFGEMGDRMLGRKNALVVSIVLITVPSVAMGLLPTYDMWGKAAPICLVLLRMLQGLSVGGQLAGSYVLSIEQSSSKTRGFRGSVCDASSVGGFLLASAVTTIVRKCLSEEAVNNWGWRIPFWFSLLLAPLLFFIVNNTEESKLWSERNEQKETEQLIREREETTQPAIVDLFGSPFRRRQLAGMVGCLCALSSSFYTLFLWTPVYLSELRGLMSEADADLLNFVVVGAYIFFLLMAGKMSTNSRTGWI